MLGKMVSLGNLKMKNQIKKLNAQILASILNLSKIWRREYWWLKERVSIWELEEGI
jgi:hypothetical protein